MSKNFISTNQELRKGDYLLSDNGNYKAILQEDGNFVIYTWSPRWATNTDGSRAFRLLLQEDTNLVLYTKNDAPLWSIGTHTDRPQQRMRLTLTDQGHLVVDNNGQTIWSSENSSGYKN